MTSSGIPRPILSSKIGKPSSFLLIDFLIDSLDSSVRFESHHPWRVPEKLVTRRSTISGGQDRDYSYKQYQP